MWLSTAEDSLTFSPSRLSTGSFCARQSTPFLRDLPGPSIGGTHGVTHKSPDAQQIKKLLAELRPGPICCQNLLDNAGTDIGMARRTPRHLPPLSPLALQLWFYAKGRSLRLENGAHFNLTKKYKRNCAYSSTKHSVCLHERICLFLFVGICLNLLAKWLWNSRGLKGSTGKPLDWIKYFKPRRQSKVVISNWKSTGLWW